MILQSSTTVSRSNVSFESGNDIAATPAGDVYVTGHLEGGAPGESDIWIAEYNSALVLQSSTTVAGSGNNTDFGSGIAVDAASGIVYVVGAIDRIPITNPASSTPAGDIWIGKTSALPPASNSLLVGSVGVSSILWTWTNAPNGTAFRVIDSMGANLSGDLAPGTLSWTETGLSTNTPITRFLETFSDHGSSTSMAVTRYTLAAPPTGLALGQVNVSSITVSWAPNTNPMGTSYLAEIWTAGGPVATTLGTTTSALFTGLTAGTSYFVTVRALNGNNIQTAPDVTLSAVTLGLSPIIPLCSREFISTEDTTWDLDPSCGPASIFMESGSYPNNVIVTASVPSSFPPLDSAVGRFNPTRIGAAISVTDTRSPRDELTFVFRYTLQDVLGMDEKRLRVVTYDEKRGLWVPVDSKVDRSKKMVTAEAENFKILLLVEQAPSLVVEEAFVSNNPFRPSLGHTEMTFSKLPADVEVRVLTLSGRRVFQGRTDFKGEMSWDTTNQNGEKVASGVYLVFVQNGDDQKVYRVSVQR